MIIQQGIPIVYALGANTRDVAEHTISLISSIDKNVTLMDVETRKANYGIWLKHKPIEL